MEIIQGGGGGNSLHPYSQQRPMRTNLPCCLGLIDNGQHKSTNRLLVVVPHERPHGIMRILKILCMLLPKALGPGPSSRLWSSTAVLTERNHCSNSMQHLREVCPQLQEACGKLQEASLACAKNTDAGCVAEVSLPAHAPVRRREKSCKMAGQAGTLSCSGR